MELNNSKTQNKQHTGDATKRDKFCMICNTEKRDIQNCWYNAKNDNRKFKNKFHNNFVQRNYGYNDTAVQIGFEYIGPVNKSQLSFIPNYIPFANQNYDNYGTFHRKNCNDYCNFSNHNFSNPNCMPQSNGEFYGRHNDFHQPFRRGNSHGSRQSQNKNEQQQKESKRDFQTNRYCKNGPKSGNKQKDIG